jgi:hypothetical protein
MKYVCDSLEVEKPGKFFGTVYCLIQPHHHKAKGFRLRPRGAFVNLKSLTTSTAPDSLTFNFAGARLSLRLSLRISLGSSACCIALIIRRVLAARALILLRHLPTLYTRLFVKHRGRVLSCVIACFVMHGNNSTCSSRRSTKLAQASTSIRSRGLLSLSQSRSNTLNTMPSNHTRPICKILGSTMRRVRPVYRTMPFRKVRRAMPQNRVRHFAFSPAGNQCLSDSTVVLPYSWSLPELYPSGACPPPTSCSSGVSPRLYTEMPSCSKGLNTAVGPSFSRPAPTHQSTPR